MAEPSSTTTLQQDKSDDASKARTKTRDEVLQEMKRSIQIYEQDLIDTYGEYNHTKCLEIMETLDKWPFDMNACDDFSAVKRFEKSLKPLKPKLRQIAQDIHERYGLEVLRCNFYVMYRFLATDENTREKVNTLQQVWDGVGEWRC